jgi:hypothetical protein
VRFASLTVAAAIASAGLLLTLTPSAAQAPAPATKAPAAPAVRPSGARPNLTSAHWDIEPHSAGPSVARELGAASAIPPGAGIVEGGAIPYRPEALARRKENVANRLKLDPEIKCYLPGTPRAMYMPFPFQIIQSQHYIMMAFEYAGAVRTIYMDNHTEAPADSWMGWSNGHWEGNTLVIDTTGFNDLSWFDRAGNFHSDQMHIVERIRPRTAETLSYEATIEDPKVFTRPWKVSFPLYKRVEPNAQILEFRCVEFVEDLIYGHLRKQPGK